MTQTPEPAARPVPPPRRRAITMWDFSWLLRRDHDENEYADVDAVLDQLAERGYDVVRIDAFPHWIAADDRGVRVEDVQALPQTDTFMWGNHRPVTVQPRAALLDFLTGLRARGLTAALSTWFTPDATGRSEQVRTPGDLARVWTETLDTIRDAGLLDTVEWVDLCNEWPLFVPSLHRAVCPAEDDAADGKYRSWTDAEVARADTFADAVRRTKAAHPTVPITLSYCTRGSELPSADDCMRLDTAAYDFTELHLWLSSVQEFVDETSFPNAYRETSQLAVHQRQVTALLDRRSGQWTGELAGLMDRWKAWADERGLPVWTTECWASVFWNPELPEAGPDPWRFVRESAETAVPMAVEKGWTGIATSNFSQPHHAGMWADAAWHRRMNDIVHG
ncbi:cellulase-like family protein [Streptomyces sp. CA-111067]|uniref:cellulase-like family protein n=1 Tax=Streptomyces sp. CA-111067 TaxID=3240046 RepID=UPI003D97761E